MKTPAMAAVLSGALASAFSVSAPPATASGERLTLALGGDVMFARQTASGARFHRGRLRADSVRRAERADLTFINLETGLCDQGRVRSEFPLFWAPASHLKQLQSWGVDVVSVANNHALDCGAEGLQTTVRALEARGIVAAGVAPLGHVRLTRRGVPISVLGATFHIPPYRSGALKPLSYRRKHSRELILLAQQLRQAYPSDLLIVSVHWGRERAETPAAWQEQLARQLVDIGTQLVVGHGSHTNQKQELYGGGLIFYSLGNALFDSNSKLSRREGLRGVEVQRVNDRWRVVSRSND